jgi:hypothetical protein
MSKTWRRACGRQGRQDPGSTIILIWIDPGFRRDDNFGLLFALDDRLVAL